MESTDGRDTSAREQITALLAAHTHYGDAGDVEAMIGLYAPEATYELPNGVLMAGTDQMRQTLGQSASMQSADEWGLEYMRHHLTTAHIELTAFAQARADSYFLNVNNRGLDHWGRWQDTFARQDDGFWRFVSRKVVVEGSAERSWYVLASGLV